MIQLYVDGKLLSWICISINFVIAAKSTVYNRAKWWYFGIYLNISSNLRPNQTKIEENMKNYINIYFVCYAALMLLIILHFILNNFGWKHENKTPNTNPSKSPSSPF